jgi:hypothetical protein
VSAFVSVCVHACDRYGRSYVCLTNVSVVDGSGYESCEISTCLSDDKAHPALHHGPTYTRAFIMCTRR